jgi:hypothetical protein
MTAEKLFKELTSSGFRTGANGDKPLESHLAFRAKRML